MTYEGTIEEAIAESLEDLSEGESTVLEHAELLAKDFGLKLATAIGLLESAYVLDPYFDHHPLLPEQWKGVTP